MQSIQENIFKESIQENKYGQPKRPIPTPNKLQRLKKEEPSYGELSIFIHW